MKRKILLSGLMTVLWVASVKAQIPTDKMILDSTQIAYMEMVKVTDSDSLKSQIKQLNKKQIQDFIQKWNASPSIGADKFRIEYFLNVRLKSGKEINFSIHSSNIQESGWITYDLKDQNYFDRLWKDIEYSE